MAVDRLVILGSKGGPSLRTTARMPTSSLLEIAGKVCVVDCGLGVTSRLVDAGIKLADIDYIFITHLHSDHILELGPLLHTAWTTNLNKRITIFGPAGMTEYLDHFYQSLQFDIDLRIDDEGRPDLRELVLIREYGEGLVLAETPRVTALKVPHPPVEECYALKMEHDGWKVTFGADTAYFTPLMEFARGSDILIHEAMLASGIEELIRITNSAKSLEKHLFASHTLVEDVGRIAHGAGVELLVLNHLVPVTPNGINEQEWLDEIAKTWKGKTVIARDGLEIRRQ
ncbi:MAG: MBL fold metallo-hydrolase [Rhodobacteraceae bacterium]|nr:MBL fold metallo-hydrolase [Paracoccaceae bacterium]